VRLGEDCGGQEEEGLEGEGEEEGEAGARAERAVADEAREEEAAEPEGGEGDEGAEPEGGLVGREGGRAEGEDDGVSWKEGREGRWLAVSRWGELGRGRVGLGLAVGEKRAHQFASRRKRRSR